MNKLIELRILRNNYYEIVEKINKCKENKYIKNAIRIKLLKIIYLSIITLNRKLSKKQNISDKKFRHNSKATERYTKEINIFLDKKNELMKAHLKLGECLNSLKIRSEEWFLENVNPEYFPIEKGIEDYWTNEIYQLNFSKLTMNILINKSEFIDKKILSKIISEIDDINKNEISSLWQKLKRDNEWNLENIIRGCFLSGIIFEEMKSNNTKNVYTDFNGDISDINRCLHETTNFMMLPIKKLQNYIPPFVT